MEDKERGSEAQEIKRISIKEFKEVGYLQELNRKFLHPLGMALEVLADDNDEYTLSGVRDYREEPDGMLFMDLSTPEHIKRANRVEDEMVKKMNYRAQKFGYRIQPLGDKLGDNNEN